LIGALGGGKELAEGCFTGTVPIVGVFAAGLLRAAFEFALHFARTEHGGGGVPILNTRPSAMHWLTQRWDRGRPRPQLAPALPDRSRIFGVTTGEDLADQPCPACNVSALWPHWFHRMATSESDAHQIS
jgi:hypothetical protein